MRGIYLLERPVLFYETCDGIWVKRLINGKLKLVLLEDDEADKRNNRNK